MRRLDGKVAIVTGAGTGIGRETAKMLAAEGATVVVNGRREPPLDAVVTEIEKAGGRARARAADVSRPADARALGEWTLATCGRVDILVNNAGYASRVRNLRWLAQEEWDEILAVNLTGVYALTQSVLGDMLNRGAGTIVTVSSVAAIRSGLMSGPVYGAAKAGVHALMRYLHNTYRQHGIRATAILPAEVDTPILERRPLPPDTTARATMMKPEDVAAAILLCVTLPARTVIEELVMSPTVLRDQSRDLEVARHVGEPGWTPPAR
jgi:NAD(P)-dependent dehydrogenase (short-subunit alcohol dehydrogenase family)